MRLVDLCEEPYERMPGVIVTCTYIKGHPTDRHSWTTVKAQDDVDKEAAHQFSHLGLPGEVRVLVNNIQAGNADAYIEILLASLHNRKRALRNVPGFGDERCE